jgi:protein-S-isoprenylcysteine O-methyltransferase Ste14
VRTRVAAALGSLTFLVVAPGVVAGLIPWWITRWQVGSGGAWWAPLRVLGAILISVGTLALLHAFGQFVVEEPTLLRRHGAQYARYRRAVHGWLPRLRPWRPGSSPRDPRVE